MAKHFESVGWNLRFCKGMRGSLFTNRIWGLDEREEERSTVARIMVESFYRDGEVSI